MQALKIFLSSPSDVAAERARAEQVIAELNAEFAGDTVFELFRWEESYYTAAETFQSQIMHPGSADIVVCIFWKRLGSILPDTFNRPDGTQRTGSEYEFELALESAQARDPRFPDIFVYRKTQQVFFSEERLEQERQEKKLLDEFWSKWFRNEQGQFTSSFKTFSATDDFASTLEQDLRAWLRKRAGSVEWDTETRGSPYRGLEAFDEQHSSMFFGRRREVDRARARLIEAATRGFPFLMIVGASGSGKSSLMRAGVLPRLLAPDSTPQIERFVRVIASPAALGPDLFERLARQVLAAFGQVGVSAGAATPVQLGASLRERPADAAHVILQLLDSLAQSLQQKDSRSTKPTTGVLLCIDQFEELFSRSEATRSELARAISVLAQTGRVWIIATMRSDYFEPLLLDSELRALRDKGASLEISPPSSADVREIVQRPAAAAKLKFEVSADGKRDVATLIEAEADQPGALPMIEFLLDRLYEMRNVATRTMTLSAFDALGGAAGAVAAHADEVLAGVSPQARASFPKLVRALVRVDSAHAKATARAAPLSDFPIGEPARELVDALAHARLLTIAGDRQEGETAPTNASVRLAHEALLDQWERLRAEIAPNLRDMQTRERLEQAFALWSEAPSRDKQRRLLRDLELEEGLDLSRRWGPELPEPLRDFVTRSERRERRVRTGESVKVAIGAGGGIAAVALALLAWLTFDNARTVTAQRDQAVYLQSRLLGERAQRILESGDASTAGLLAAISLGNASACQLDLPAPRCMAALSVLRKALAQQLPNDLPVLLNAVFESPGTVLDVAVDSSGTRLASAHWNGEVDVRRVDNGRRIAALRAPNCLDSRAGETQACRPSKIAFLRNGSLLVGYWDGSLRLWAIGRAEITAEWPARFNSELRSLAVSTDEQSVLVVPVADPAWVQPLQPNAVAIPLREDARAVALDDGCAVDGHFIGILYGDVVSFDASGQIKQRGTIANAWASVLECSNGPLLVASDAVSRIDPVSLQLTPWIDFSASMAVVKATRSMDGRWLAISTRGDDQDDHVAIIDLNADVARGRFRTYGGSVYGLTFGRGGQLFTGGRDWRLASWSLSRLGSANIGATIQLRSNPATQIVVDHGRRVVGVDDAGFIFSYPTDSAEQPRTRNFYEICPSGCRQDVNFDSDMFGFGEVVLIEQRGLSVLDLSTLQTTPWVALPVSASQQVLARNGPVIVLAGDADNVAIPFRLDGQRTPSSEPIVHAASISATAISSQQEQIVTGDALGRVQIWTASRGVIRRWTAHERGVNAVAIDTSNSIVATTDDEGLVRLWTLAGLEIGEFGVGESINRLFFPARGGYLIGVGGGNAFRWRVDRSSRQNKALVLDARASGVSQIDPDTGALYAQNRQGTSIAPVSWTPAVDLPPQVEVALAQVIADRPLSKDERQDAFLPASASLITWPDDREACDDLSSAQFDPDRYSRAVDLRHLDIERAHEACERAVNHHPREARFHALLARVEDAQAQQALKEGDLTVARQHFDVNFREATRARQLRYRWANLLLSLNQLTPESSHFNERLGIQASEAGWRAGLNGGAVNLAYYYLNGTSGADGSRAPPGFRPNFLLHRLWSDRAALALDFGGLANVADCWSVSAQPKAAGAPEGRCDSYRNAQVSTGAREALALYHIDLATMIAEFSDASAESIERDYKERHSDALRVPPLVAGCVHLRAQEVAVRAFRERAPSDQSRNLVAPPTIEILPSTRDACARALSREHIVLRIGSPLADQAREERHQ